MKHTRVHRIRRIGTRRIRLKTSQLIIDRPGAYPMSRAFAALELEGKDAEEAAKWIWDYGFERAMMGEFRFMKDIIDTIDGPPGS